MLRISRGTTTDHKSAVLLRLEGQVTGQWVEEVRRACNEATTGESGRGTLALVLDLAGVSFIDNDGVALFRDLMACGVKLTNGSIFVTEQLKEAGNGNR